MVVKGGGSTYGISVASAPHPLNEQTKDMPVFLRRVGDDRFVAAPAGHQPKGVASHELLARRYDIFPAGVFSKTP